MRRLRLFLAALFFLVSRPAVAQYGSRVLYDSGSVAAGAVVNSPVLDLQTARVSEVTVVVDNTAGTALRNLTLTSYLEDGTTVIDSLVLRKVAFGAAANGSDYDPGRARGYVGPNPPGGASGVYVLADSTGAANTQQNLGPFTSEEADEIYVHSKCSAGTSQLYLYEIADDGSQSGTLAVNAAAAEVANFMGPGSAPPTTPGLTVTVLPMPIPRRFSLAATAAGVGNTTRVRVLARGRPPGTFAVEMVLPPKAKFSLAAAGAGAARVVVLGH